MDDVTFGQVLNFATLVVVPVLGLWVRSVHERNNADIAVLQEQVASLSEQLTQRDDTIRAQAIKIESLQEQITNLLLSQAQVRKRF